MSYRIEAREPVEESLRRVAREQLDKALDELGSDELDIHERIHQVRKRAKKIRALVRLVRPAFDDYSEVNRAARDAARRLSELRDAEARLETLAAVDVRRGAARLERQLEPVRERLREERARLLRVHVSLEGRPAQAEADLEALRATVERWRLDEEGFDAIEGGLRKTYRRARRAMKRCLESEEAEDVHEWRKRAKYHRYHVRLLRGIWPALMKTREKELHRLTDFLGDAHDRYELQRGLETILGSHEAPAAHSALGLVVDQERLALRRSAWDLGARLFVEAPGDHVQRMRILFEAARGKRGGGLPAAAE